MKSKKSKDPMTDIEGDVPKNGIESLLKASALTTKWVFFGQTRARI